MFPCQSSWNFDKKNEYNNIIRNWCMIFQVSDFKGKYFLDLLYDNLNLIESSYIKGGSWIKHFRHSNSLCTRVTRAITNHAPIGKYYLQFFSYEKFSYLCRFYPIAIRCHILYKCKKFNNYWNPIGVSDTISHFVSFLEYDPNTFFFGKNIT